MQCISLFFILSTILISCGLQKHSPLLLKGEEFYGKRELEYTREYNLMRENTNYLVKKEKTIMNKIYADDDKAQNMKMDKINYKFVMPIEGSVISTISSNKECKDGIKIAAQGTTNVVASANGKVIYMGKGLRWYGNLIVLEHEDNYVTMYSYLKRIHVGVDDKIKQGQVIGSVGKTSTHSKDLQMCFAIRHEGQVVDPLKHINCS